MLLLIDVFSHRFLLKTYYSSEWWNQALNQLAQNDFIVIDNFLPTIMLEELEVKFLRNEILQKFEPAKIGSSEIEQRKSEIRSDFTLWLERSRDTDILGFFELIDELIKHSGELLFLSLQGYEFHFANYPVGGFYKPHLDQFDSRSNRMLSLVIYLNNDWQKGDGGELKIHSPKIEIIEPLYNRAVLFRSDIVLHEVLPSYKKRRSITGWLLKRPSGVGILGI